MLRTNGASRPPPPPAPRAPDWQAGDARKGTRPPYALFVTRELCVKREHEYLAYDLKKRAYIGPTSTVNALTHKHTNARTHTHAHAHTLAQTHNNQMRTLCMANFAFVLRELARLCEILYSACALCILSVFVFCFLCFRPPRPGRTQDAQLAFYMANAGLVRRGSLVFDPFAGTGSLLVAAAHFGRWQTHTRSRRKSKQGTRER